MRDTRPEEDRLGAWRSMLHANAALTAVLGDELEREHGLPVSWYDVLLKLNEAGGRMRMHELAEAILLSKSGLTRLVDRMVDAGYVAREQCPSDRRGLLAVLTPEGKAMLRKAAPTHLQGIEDHFASLVDAREAAVLREVGDRLLAHVRGLGCAPVDEAHSAGMSDAVTDTETCRMGLPQ